MRMEEDSREIMEQMRRSAQEITRVYRVNNVATAWNDLCDESQNGSFCIEKSAFAKYLEKLSEEKYITKISYQSDLQLYRARRVSIGDYNKLDFSSYPIRGFDKSNSGAPPSDKAPPGRANPCGVSYLYLASDPVTACAEVQPSPLQLVSVAQFRLRQDVSILDLTHIDLQEPDDLKRSELHRAASNVMWSFMAPTGEDREKMYAVSQCIAKFFRDKGRQGIKYASSHNSAPGSFNLVLFDPSLANCESNCGTIYRCNGESRTFQKMIPNLANNEKTFTAKAGIDQISDENMMKIYRGISIIAGIKGHCGPE